MGLGIAHAYVCLLILEVPRLDHDEITLAHPLPASHLARDASEAAFAILADCSDPASTEYLIGDCKHLVHLPFWKGDADAVAAGFQPSQKLCVDLLFPTSHEAASIVPYVKLSISNQLPIKESTAEPTMSSSELLSGPMPKSSVSMAHAMMAILKDGTRLRGFSVAGDSKNMTKTILR